MGKRLKLSVDCGLHSDLVRTILYRILRDTQYTPCIRQDGECGTEEFSVAIGTRFIQFFNVPPDIYENLKEVAEKNRSEALPSAEI